MGQELEGEDCERDISELITALESLIPPNFSPSRHTAFLHSLACPSLDEAGASGNLRSRLRPSPR